MNPSQRNRIRIPWATAALAAIALGLLAAPHPLRTELLYSRPDVASGQLWRLWTGHWVHFGARHAAWDLLVFIIVGGLLELRSRALHATVVAIAPALIAVTLFAAQPRMTVYGGLSGVNLALAAALGVLGAKSTPRWPWLAILALVAAKCASDFSGYHISPIVFDTPDVRPAPLAHLAGAIVGAATAALWRPSHPKVRD